MSKKKENLKSNKAKKPVANRPSWKVDIKYPALLFFLSFLFYSNTLFHDYTQDDAIVIYDNMFTQKGIAGIPGLLKYDTFYGFFKEEGKAKLVAGGRYRPLTPIMFAIEYQFFGGKPFVGHFMNVLLFAGLVVLLFYVLLQFKLFKDPSQNLFFAFAAAIIFACHPIHTEVVANIKGRDEIVALLGSLFALFFAFKWHDKPHTKYAIFGAISLFLALLSKENAITFLLIIPMSLFYFRKIKYSQIFKKTLPFFIAVVFFMLLRTWVLGFDFGDAPKELMNNPFIKIVNNQYLPFDFSEKLATILFIMGKYLQLLFFPIILTHDYYPRHIDVMHFSDPAVWMSVVMYVSLILLFVIGFLKKDIASYCILFFLATISIVSNIVFPIGTNMSERFLFMPSVALCILLGVGFTRLKDFKKVKNLAFITLAILVGLFSIKTVTRNQVWKDDFTLFTSDIEISKNSAKLNNAAGGALSTRATKLDDPKAKEEMLRRAIPYLEKANKIHPNYKNSYLIKGNVYHWLLDYENAESAYQNALRIDPNYADAIGNRAVNFRELGKSYGMKGEMEQSIVFLEKAYDQLSEDYETIRLLGIAHGIKSNHQKAIQFFTQASKISPNNAGAYVNLGNAYRNSGDEITAQIQYQKALQIDPNALNN